MAYFCFNGFEHSVTSDLIKGVVGEFVSLTERTVSLNSTLQVQEDLYSGTTFHPQLNRGRRGV